MAIAGVPAHCRSRFSHDGTSGTRDFSFKIITCLVGLQCLSFCNKPLHKCLFVITYIIVVYCYSNFITWLFNISCQACPCAISLIQLLFIPRRVDLVTKVTRSATRDVTLAKLSDSLKRNLKKSLYIMPRDLRKALSSFALYRSIKAFFLNTN